MKKTWSIIGIFMIIGAYAFQSGRAGQTPERAIARTLIAQIDTFSGLIDSFRADIKQDRSQQELQRDFLQIRLAYKKWEWVAEYFNPAVARLINGPPVPEAEPVLDADPSPETPGDPRRFLVLKPKGLQVIEALLFPRYDTAHKTDLLEYLRQLQADGNKYKGHFDNIELLNWQVFDAAKLEVFRILTLGIAGFDAPLSLNCMQEAAAALEGTRVAIGHYNGRDGRDDGGGGEEGDSLATQFRSAGRYLRRNTGFTAFDRALFITRYGNPITRGITRLEADLHIPVARYNRLLRQDAATLFDKDAFDADAYAPGPEYTTNAGKIALGKRLFSDPMLSSTRTRSCASCHQPDKAFADGLTRNTVAGSRELLARNTPTLLNAALQPAQFYDLRVATLEDQVRDVLQNPLEMQCSVQTVATRLGQDTLYRRLFADAFTDAFALPASSGPATAAGPATADGRTTIDTLEVMNALAAYVRSLVRLNSRFDDYMRGDSSALDDQEIKGFNLFMGKARCGTCHYMPLFNGVFPPRYTVMETEVIGVPGPVAGSLSVPGRTIDPDMGRFSIVPAPFLRHAFKTTTIRNAARTAPYMHNGVFATLEEVIDFYNNGGGAGAGWRVDNQTLATDSLHLATGEKNALIAFIKSLDSR